MTADSNASLTGYRVGIANADGTISPGFISDSDISARYVSDNEQYDQMGQPIHGRSNYNAWKQLGSIWGSDASILDKVQQTGAWATYTVPDAKQKSSETLMAWGYGAADGRFAQLAEIEASPLGGISWGATALLGGSERAQNLALNIGSAFEGLVTSGSSLTGRVPLYFGTQSAIDIPSYWPLNNGFVGNTVPQKLQPGYLFSRYGGYFDNSGFRDSGAFGAPVNVPFGMRALPQGSDMTDPLSTYRILKPINVISGLSTPWFGQQGLGVQHQFPMTIEDLINQKYIESISRVVPPNRQKD